MAYFNQANYIKALEYYHHSLKISKENNNTYEIALSINNISRLYYS